MKEQSIVRENLMTEKQYTPYCGAGQYCTKKMPRTRWDGDLSQFVCQCGWRSQFPGDFIKRYKKQWGYE